MSNRPILTPLRRWCVKCNQARELKGGRIVGGKFICADCK